MIDRWGCALIGAGFCGLSLGVPACSPKIHGTIPPPEAKVASGSFRAGAGIADLTPIPGIPMAGYSVEGKIARGVWARLRARALYFEDAQGDALVLVACDLDMIPNGLPDQVAALLRERNLVRHLARGQILLAASHTHHGPGNYFTDQMYNGFATARPGFDKELFDFLAMRIAEAIETAYANSTEAVLRTAPPPGSAGAPDDRLPCAFRNRSRPAFDLNSAAEVAAVHSENPLPVPCPARCPDPLACRSVRQRIDFLEIVDAAAPTQVIGVAVFLAAHATVLSADNEIYSPDFFGVASTLLESGATGCLGGSPAPVVAVFNGAQGDVSPAWEQGRRDRRGVLEIATEVAKKVCVLLPSAVSQTGVDIAYRWAEIAPLADRAVEDPFDRRAPWEQRTARKALVGAAALGGAEDGRTVFYDMGFVEGLRGPGRDDHGAKQAVEVNVLGSRTSVAAALTSPAPTQAPIGVYRLGNLALMTLPGEITTMLGHRVRRHVANQLGFVPERVLLMGLTGGHVSYVTTAEEYEAQHYEGAQNLYGAATGSLLAQELGHLAQSLGAPTPAVAPRSYRYDPGQSVRWRVRDVAGPPYEAHQGLEAVVQDAITGQPRADFPTFCFRDAVPRLSEIQPIGGSCHRALPEVFVETAAGTAVSVAGIPQNSASGLDVVTVLTGAGKDKTSGKDATEWCAIWMVPQATTAAHYRFRIEPIAGASFTSPAFLAGGASSTAFFAYAAAWPAEPLVPDRADGILCSWLAFLGLCPEPKVCQAP